MSASPGGGVGGVFAAVVNLATTLLASARTRLELLSNEIEEEKLRAMRLLVAAQSMLFCLGLAIVLAIAQAHGGHAWVTRSAQHGGAMFVLVLPTGPPTAYHPGEPV